MASTDTRNVIAKLSRGYIKRDIVKGNFEGLEMLLTAGRYEDVAACVPTMIAVMNTQADDIQRLDEKIEELIQIKNRAEALVKTTMNETQRNITEEVKLTVELAHVRDLLFTHPSQWGLLPEQVDYILRVIHHYGEALTYKLRTHTDLEYGWRDGYYTIQSVVEYIEQEYGKSIKDIVYGREIA